MKPLFIVFFVLNSFAFGNPEAPEIDTDIVDKIPDVKLPGKEIEKTEAEKQEAEKTNETVKKTEKKEVAAEETTEEVEEKEEVPKPEVVTIHTIEKGGTLGQVSEKAYGRTRYWRILKLYNEVDPSKLKVGQLIKAPDLTWLLKSCKLEAKFPEVAQTLLNVKKGLIQLEDANPKLVFDENQKAEILKLSELIEKSEKTLNAKHKGVKSPPYATLKQLRTCRTFLNQIAAGKKSRRNPHSLAHEHLSNAIVYSVLWARDGFK